MNGVTATVHTKELSDPSFVSIARGPYDFWSREVLGDGVANKLLAIIREKVDLSDADNAPTKGEIGVLGGRAVSRGLEVPGLGRVFVKKYAHGGLLRAITASKFIGFGACRAQQEFQMLERVRALGVRSPRPLVFVKKGAFVYSTWLIMEEIQNVRSLVEISVDDPDSLHDSMRLAGEQIGLLIKNRILHIDLHPGNILVDASGGVYIVDFDKARSYVGSAWALRDMYLRRWRRAVIKHKLSPILTELMSLSLRSYNE